MGPNADSLIPHWRASRLPILVYFLVTLCLVCLGWMAINSSWSNYDDEGYLLSTLAEASKGGEPYVDYYLQYGPFWLGFWSTIFTSLELPVIHATGRALTLLVWLASALLIALVTRCLGRSHTMTLVGGVLSFFVLIPLIREPLHPVGLLGLLAGVLLLALCSKRKTALKVTAIGVVISMMFLIKINIGALALLGLAFYWGLRSWNHQRVLGILLVFASLLPSLWLVRSQLLLALVFALSLAALLRLGTHSRSDSIGVREAWLTGLGLSVPFLILVAFWLIREWSLYELLQGIALRPLSHPSTFAIPLSISGLTVALSFTALAFSLKSRPSNVGAASILGLAGLSTGYAALLPSSAPLTASAKTVRPNDPILAIGSLAIFLFLGVFPVAGSQVALASLAFVPLTTFALVTTVRRWTKHSSDSTPQRMALVRIMVLVITLALVTTTMWSALAPSWSYLRNPTTELQDFGPSRLPESQAKELLAVSEWVKANCDVLVTDPGLHTFNQLSDVPYPGRVPATAWYRMLNESEQRRMIKDLDVSSRPCLIRDELTRMFWLGNQEPTATVLDTYLRETFTITDVIGRYQLGVAAR